MNFSKTDAVVLKSKSYGEKDKIITFYTKEFGKVKVKAKGVRKTKSKLAGILQPFNLIYISYVKGRIFFVITEAMQKERLVFYENSFKKIVYGLYVLDLVDNFIEEGEKNKYIFDLLVSTLRLIDKVEDKDLVIFSFVIKFLSLLGYEPTLEKCVKCEKNMLENMQQKKLKFSFTDGGVVCEKCADTSSNVQEVYLQSVKVLYFLLKSNTFKIINISDAAREGINNLLDLYIYYILGKNIRSKRFQQISVS